MSRRRFAIPALPEITVSKADDLPTVLDQLRQTNLIGLDTEFVGEESYRPELCLIQVSTNDCLYLIDPLTCGPVDEFWHILTEPGHTVVMHAGREETRICRHAIGKTPESVFDVQIAAGMVGLTYPMGYGGLVHEILGEKTHKSETLTDWRRRPLSAAQIRYAFDDVRFLLPMHRWLNARLTKLKRSDWLTEEMTRALAIWTTDTPPMERWRKLKGIGALSARHLAVVRALAAWRDEHAARLNRPIRSVLRDDLLCELAKRPPQTLADLERVRGLPRGQSSIILEIIRQAQELPPADWPQMHDTEIDPPNIASLANLLNVILNDLGNRLMLAPNLIASGQDLKALIRHQQSGTTNSKLLLKTGWRDQIIRPHLQAILDGRTAICVTDPTKSAPIALVPLKRHTEETEP